MTLNILGQNMLSIPQRLLGEALLNSASEYPDKTAIIVKNKEYSYSQLKSSAIIIASHLVSNGLKKDDRVAVYMNNSWECIVSIYGITIAGAAFIVINPQTKADKLRYILSDSGTKVLLAEAGLKHDILPAVENAAELTEVIIYGSTDQFQKGSYPIMSEFEDIISSEISADLPRIIPNDLAALIYTSGSTGFPKGVMMTHQSMVFTSWSLIEYLRLSREDRILTVLPFSFDYGLYQLLLAITIGGTLIVEQSFLLPKFIYHQIQLYRPTVFPAVPTMYAMMIEDHKHSGISFNCIQKITNTAAALPAEYLPHLRTIFPNAFIFKMYGLTECKRVCYLEPELIDLKPNSVGKAIPGTEVFLLSPEGNPVSPGEKGILYIRGPHVMLGYWNKPELSKEMLRQGKLPYERILCSNDWFTMDEEGFLYFHGRTDDIIKSRGQKISPVEIENTLHNISGVKEAAVIGIPDKSLGEAIIAYVCLLDKNSLNEMTIQKACLDRLEFFMLPNQFIFIDEMPKNSNGKIDKLILKETYLILSDMLKK